MRYMYAVVNDIGKCYQVYRSTNCSCDKYHVPVNSISPKYLSKYYYPMPNVVDNDSDFVGKWYYDIDHTIEVK